MNIKSDMDTVLPFSFKEGGIKGKIIRLNNVTDKILTRFASISVIDELFLEALAFSALLSSNLKNDGLLKLQINCFSGCLKAILIDATNKGDVRGLVSLNKIDGKQVDNNNVLLPEILADGYMLIHLKEGTNKPYQTIISLENTKTFIEGINSFFQNSEQIKTYIKIFTNVKDKSVSLFFLQAMPSRKQKAVESENYFDTFVMLADTLKDTEIHNYSLTNILYMLYNQYSVLVYEKASLRYKCSCSKAKINELMKNTQQENPKEKLKIQCSFCGAGY